MYKERYVKLLYLSREKYIEINVIIFYQFRNSVFLAINVI